MGVLDFLFGGKPPPNTAPTGGTVNVPQYLSDAGMQVVNKANAIYNNDTYQPSPIPKVAPANAEMQKSWDTVDQTAGKYDPAIKGALATAGGVSPTAHTGYDTAAGTVASGLGSFTGDTVNQYMNPYLDNVTNRSAQLATRNFNENMLPGLNSMYVGSGQFGSTPNASVAFRGARDVSQNIQDDANATYAAGYDTAGSNFRADQQRRLQGGMDQAAIAGDRANTDLNAATTTGNLAQTGQGMGYRDAAALDAAGNEQRGITQQSLDAANADFAAQRDFQKNNLNQYEAVIDNAPGSSRSYTGVAPAGSTGPSVAGQGTGIATGMSSLYGPVAAKGGLIRAANPQKDIPGWLKSAMLELLEKHAAA